MSIPACAVAPAAALVIVAGGGRALAWPVARVRAALVHHAAGRPVLQLLHGDARGADQLIAAAARQLGWSVVAIAAEWHRHGRRAGPIRNRQLLEQALALATSATPAGSVLVIAFPGGAGPASLVQQARRSSLHVPMPVVVEAVEAQAA
ncbi:MAG: SLOG family protein [Prochlorococcaceae cyanobacterium]